MAMSKDVKKRWQTQAGATDRPPRAVCPNCKADAWKKTSTVGLWECASCKKHFQRGEAYKLLRKTSWS